LRGERDLDVLRTYGEEGEGQTKRGVGLNREEKKGKSHGGHRQKGPKKHKLREKRKTEKCMLALVTVERKEKGS